MPSVCYTKLQYKGRAATKIIGNSGSDGNVLLGVDRNYLLYVNACFNGYRNKEKGQTE